MVTGHPPLLRKDLGERGITLEQSGLDLLNMMRVLDHGQQGWVSLREMLQVQLRTKCCAKPIRTEK
jgi:hypothetical protein